MFPETNARQKQNSGQPDGSECTTDKPCDIGEGDCDYYDQCCVNIHSWLILN